MVKSEDFEQFRDIYCGRLTYSDDEDWIANMDAVMKKMCDDAALDFTPQELDDGCSDF